MTGRLGWAIALLVPALVAVVCYARTLTGSFLSDDFLLSALYAGDGHSGVDWGPVLADFTRPWFGLEAPLYRPLLTLSFAVDITLNGPDPFGYHVANLLMHVVAVVSTAIIAAVLATPPGQACVTPSPARLAAALCAGCLVAVHPVTAESVSWIAARNSGLEVAFRNAALALFALGLAQPSRFRLVGSVALAACALATKESAVLLAPSILAIDWIQRPTASLSQRARSTAPILILVALYFVWRIVLFGTPIGSAGGTETSVDFLGLAGTKVQQVLWPSSGPFHLAWWGAAGLIALYLLAAFGSLTRGKLAVLAALAWFASTLAPTYALEVFEGFSGSRLILDTTHVAAIVLSVLLFAPVTKPGRMPTIPIAAPVLATALACAGMALGPTSQRIDRFVGAWDEIHAAMPPLRELAQEIRDTQPLALVSMPQTPTVPPLNQNCWFPLLERPFQAHDYPLVSLGYLTVPVPGAEPLLHDASAAAALWHARSVIATWSPDTKSFLQVQEKPRGAPRAPELQRAGPEHRLLTPCNPMAIEAVRLSTTGSKAIHRGSIRILPAAIPATWEFTADQRLPSGEIEVDLTHSLLPSFMSTANIPSEGFTVEAFDNAGQRIPDQTLVLEAIPRLAGIDTSPLPPFRGTVDELAEQVRGPISEGPLSEEPLPGDAPLRYVLLGPHGALTGPVTPRTGELVLDDDQRDLLNVIAGYSRSSRFYVFFESSPDAPPPHRRSALLGPVVVQPR